MKKIVILLMIAISLISCDSAINSSSGSDSYNIQNDLAGTWKIKMQDGTTSSVYISVNGNQVGFIGGTYTGTFSSSSFSGSFKQGPTKWQTYISMSSKNRISGDVTFSGGGYSSSETFTGTR